DIPFMDVRRFVAKSLLAEDTPPNRPFRIDPATLEPSAAYRFCESNDEETRALGMELINRLPKLRVPEELFRLAESPDRKVRAFVIRALWAVYRDRGITPDWKPPAPPKPTVGARAKKAAEKAEADRGLGEGILPLLDEFMLSRGKSEHDACLVAVTRIRHKYPELKA